MQTDFLKKLEVGLFIAGVPAINNPIRGCRTGIELIGAASTILRENRLAHGLLADLVEKEIQA